MKHLKYDELVRVGACKDQLALFKQHFGEGGEVTPAKAVAVAGLFDWHWAVRRFLSPAQRKAYHAATAEASKAYYAAMAEAHKAYRAAMAEAFANAFNL